MSLWDSIDRLSLDYVGALEAVFPIFLLAIFAIIFAMVTHLIIDKNLMIILETGDIFEVQKSDFCNFLQRFMCEKCLV